MLRVTFVLDSWFCRSAVHAQNPVRRHRCKRHGRSNGTVDLSIECLGLSSGCSAISSSGAWYFILCQHFARIAPEHNGAGDAAALLSATELVF